MGQTKKQKAERDAIKAGTHELADDGFGNKFLRELPEKPKEWACNTCNGKVVAIDGKQLTPGDLLPYKHAAGSGRGCARFGGPLATEDVHEV